MEVLIEAKQLLDRYEVDEAVTDVALIFDVAGQVQKIVGVGQYLIDLLGQLLDAVLVGYVSDHDCGTRISQNITLVDIVALPPPSLIAYVVPVHVVD